MGVISKTTLHDMLCEMQSFILVSQTDMDAAETCDVDTGNSPELKRLVEAWGRGAYDEDPQLMHQALRNLLPPEVR